MFRLDLSPPRGFVAKQRQLANAYSHTDDKKVTRVWTLPIPVEHMFWRRLGAEISCILPSQSYLTYLSLFVYIVYGPS